MDIYGVGDYYYHHYYTALRGYLHVKKGAF